VSEQGEVYAAFIDAELKSEHTRRADLDVRAQGSATSSSAFVALAGTLTALAVGKDHTIRHDSARGVLLSMFLLLTATGLALLAHGTKPYDVTDAGTLDKMLRVHWTDKEVDARNVTAEQNVKTIESLRKGNNRKAGLLVGSHVLQMSGLAGLTVTLAWELLPRLR